MANSSSIVLVCNFSVGNRHSGKGKQKKSATLESFVDYMARQEALRKSEKKNGLSDDELEEMKRIEKALEKISISDEPDQEGVVKDVLQIEKYIDYMARKKALVDKGNEEVLGGAFSSWKRHMTQEDVKGIKKMVVKAKKNNAVMYRDVLSFDNNFLIEEGYLDPKTNKLDEEAMYRAVTEMTGVCSEQEKLSNNFWFGAIHRNTDNIHIHVTLMENVNTRRIVDFEDQLEARGMRKKSTIDSMKHAVGNSLLNQKKELSRISELRSSVPKEFSNELKNGLMGIYISQEDHKDKNLIIHNLVKSLKEEIPRNVRGYNELPEETRIKINVVTKSLTKNNAGRKEYLDNARVMDDLYKKTYGDSHKANSFYENREQILNERLGNAFVREMKNVKNSESKKLSGGDLKKMLLEKNRTYNPIGKPNLKTKVGEERYKEFVKKVESNRLVKEEREKSINKVVTKNLNRKDFKKVDRAINDDSEMNSAEQDYEEMIRKVEREKYLREQGFEM
ncbi:MULTISPECIES: MobP2 family relaxase [Vagococcus]|uniref:ATPase involved in DNA repair n=1 Tax=Vagococcus fluvialis bH819 TaxID=1255619 RepID=A0A1X6WS56_9ENTE|nr:MULTISPECIES: MobP2 family relaxase [Vagococcus]SLM87072.1 ATPase involved in DNA repair [Vagococcus fluvialis bH819]HCM90582.1 hypothetical protein [Vagococcus sp.]